MIDTSALTVHTASMPNGSLFLWGMRDRGGAWEALDLKHMLFAWHEPSFYGTLIEEKEMGQIEGVELEPIEALDYFTAPSCVEHVRFKWSESAEAIRRLAPAVHSALAGERFLPSYEHWRKGEVGWKLDLPEDAQSFVSEDAQRWMDAVVPAWIAVHGGAERLHQLEQAFPRMRQGEVPHDLWLDEDDWLVAIGWQHDAAAFRTCIQLVEPEGRRDWQLRVLLQDRADGSIIRAVDGSGALLPEEAPLPEHWTPDIDRVQKDTGKWLRLLPWLTTADHDGSAKLPIVLGHDGAWRFLSEGSAKLIAAGYTVFLPAWWDRVRRLRPRLRAKLRSELNPAGVRQRESLFGITQLMQFDWKLAIGDLELTEDEFTQLLNEKRSLVQIRGQWIQLDPKALSEISAAIRKLQQSKGLSLRDALALHLLGTGGNNRSDAFVDEDAELEADRARFDMEVELTEHLEQMIDKLVHTKHIPEVVTPAAFQGDLRHYQRQGASWLLFLRQFGLGGCLADDMGLGKTIQWITYLLSVKDRAAADQALHPDSPKSTPSLLICPTSVLGNWQMELKRFAPTLRVHLHYGPQRLKGQTFADVMQDEVDLVLTSYNLSHIDEEELNMIHWDSICLDEAQNIKNAYTKQSAAIRKLSGFHRIAMTGTPVENRLAELWSIFEFINPGYLGTLRDFTHRYVSPIESVRDPEALASVQKLVRPFLLRRVKNDPAIQLDLPEKNETKVFVSLTAEQSSLYENYIQDMFSRIDKMSTMERRGHILTALTKLKQLCNHPALLLKEGPQAVWEHRSNKVERLTEMVQELRQEGDKCLIFTQFVETGFLLQRILQEEIGENVIFLNGSTPKTQRDAMIAHFQDRTLPEENQNNIFILSLKAGGIGLNLTAANHVFHFDRWWNPAVENQATDRAYRIGQTRNVQVHKFITIGTLEERVNELMEGKLGLAEGIVGKGESWITEMSESDLRELFTLRTEWS
ncbi:DEAD/DEAH box helicase [Paenibacillus sp. N1-5-1-14]|uniref:DEAD/DEAH box helicase n=1 Tax=Paenibacillus radicibacter TaxID=2972488 RepID=UPI002158D577|nr:DEAD/DEAH box helicase [Paenibacillus radicibacter]MCR8642604.1 DEAD/DEAH box helicase [Paenibacillus radicibacter]